MNLYQVSIINVDYCTFVFAETRNKAKYMVVNRFGQEEYCDLRAKLLKKDVGGIATVVEHEGDEHYSKVLGLGFGFREVEEE